MGLDSRLPLLPLVRIVARCFIGSHPESVYDTYDHLPWRQQLLDQLNARKHVLVPAMYAYALHNPGCMVEGTLIMVATTLACMSGDHALMVASLLTMVPQLLQLLAHGQPLFVVVDGEASVRRHPLALHVCALARVSPAVCDALFAIPAIVDVLRGVTRGEITRFGYERFASNVAEAACRHSIAARELFATEHYVRALTVRGVTVANAFANANFCQFWKATAALEENFSALAAVLAVGDQSLVEVAIQAGLPQMLAPMLPAPNAIAQELEKSLVPVSYDRSNESEFGWCRRSLATATALLLLQLVPGDASFLHMLTSATLNAILAFVEFMEKDAYFDDEYPMKFVQREEESVSSSELMDRIKNLGNRLRSANDEDCQME